jgi:hypothetical protein
MRVPTTVAFNQFLLANSHYPFNRLKATRSSFFCKWIMLKGQSPIGLTYYFPVFANSHRNEVLLGMIATGQAKPFPPELSHVMDNMFWWGKSHSHQWYEQVIDSIGEILENNDKHEEDEQQREIVRYLISLQVKSMIQESFDLLSVPLFAVVMDQWLHNFNCTYKKDDVAVGGRYTFFAKWLSILLSMLNGLLKKWKLI